MNHPLASHPEEFLDGRDQDAPQADLLHLVVGGQELLARASEVAEVVRPMRLTPVPMGPAHLLGLANIHGRVVCIIEPSGVVNLPPTGEETPNTRFVVLRHPRMHVGIRVDAVPSMHRVPVDRLPDSGAPENTADFSVAEVEVDGKLLPLLHVESLLH